MFPSFILIHFVGPQTTHTHTHTDVADVTHCSHRSCYSNTIKRSSSIGATTMMTITMIAGQLVAGVETISPTPIRLAAMPKAKTWNVCFKLRTGTLLGECFEWFERRTCNILCFPLCNTYELYFSSLKSTYFLKHIICLYVYCVRCRSKFNCRKLIALCPN